MDLRKRKRDCERDWSFLPPECVVLIAERIGRLKDLARLRSVCTAWSWALGWSRKGWPLPPLSYKPEFAPLDNSGVPWMLTPNMTTNGASYCLISHLSDASRSLVSDFPEVTGRHRIGGSGDGCWIVTLDLYLNPAVVNPLTGEEFALPSLRSVLRFDPTLNAVYSRNRSVSEFEFENNAGRGFTTEQFRYSYFQKIILSSAPPLGIAVVLFGFDCGYLAFARIGDREWHPGPDPSHNLIFQYCKDVMYREEDDKFYVTSMYGDVITLDLSSYNWGSFERPNNITVLTAMHSMEPFRIGPLHTVFSTAGDLLQVWRTVHRDDRTTRINGRVRSCLVGEQTAFVYVFKFHRSFSTWMRLEDLGDEAIFVGCNYSMAVSTADKPCLQRNSIYFLEDTNFLHYPYCRKGSRDGGIFCLETNQILHRFFAPDSHFNWPPPLWCVPSRLRLTCT